MRILLSGASGLLGSAIVERLSRTPDAELTVIRSSRAECTLPLGSTELFIEDPLDSSKLKRALSARPPTHILHLGALSSPAECERDPALAYVANVSFTRTLTDLARSFDSHIIFTSTDLVFDGGAAPQGGFDEYSTPLPVSVYARTKRQAEMEVLHQTDGAVMRLSLLYGHTLSTSKGVLGWIEGALRERRELTLFRDEFRTPLYLGDAAHILLLACTRELSGVWHCGGPTRLSRLEFCHLVARLGGFSEEDIRAANRSDIPAAPARPEDVSLNSQRLSSLLGFTAQTPLTALERLYSDKLHTIPHTTSPEVQPKDNL